MQARSIWITGPTRSGKTTRLVEEYRLWVEMFRSEMSPLDRLSLSTSAGVPAQGSAGAGGQKNRSTQNPKSKIQNPKSDLPPLPSTPGMLVFAANGWVELADMLATATAAPYPVHSSTPLRFFRDQVILFWPLLIQQLNLRAQFPLRLRPETEQELATWLWRPELDAGTLRQEGVSETRLVRRTLDLLQLAAASGTPVEDIPLILQQGWAAGQESTGMLAGAGELLLRWRSWCLERGLLTYGIICELYWRHLLPDPTYQLHLTRRFRAVLADDVDEYPAIARHLFDFLLDAGCAGAFTHNPDGAVRLGLDADPEYMAGLAGRCQVETLTQESGLAKVLGEPAVELAVNSLTVYGNSFPLDDSVRLIQTTSRAQLLRRTAEIIIDAVKSGQVQPEEIAVITPGLDAIARYTLMEILGNKGIAVEPLNEQRPLASSPVIRALLTLLALVYPGLGRLLDRDAVAEMLVVLSRQPQGSTGSPVERRIASGSLVERRIASGSGGEKEDEISPLTLETSGLRLQTRSPLTAEIDPVRAGLLVDHCFYPDIEYPRLLPVMAFPRWDRLGYRATRAYKEIADWIKTQRLQLEQRLIPSPVSVIDRAIQQFMWRGGNLPYDQLTALRELIKIAQHYWEVDGRLRQSSPRSPVKEGVGAGFPVSTGVEQFILLLRRGTISASPYPKLPVWPTGGAVTLGTIFQYRFNRKFHRWHFWLDAGSPLWQSSGEAVRFGAFLFLQSRFGRPWGEEEAIFADEARLRRILLDLLGRAGERLFLCHSDLAVNGQEQTGPLLSLVNAAMPVSEPVLI